MENTMNTPAPAAPHKNTAKEVSVFLGLLLALYAIVGASLAILYTAIEAWFPPVDEYYSWYANPSISFPAAVLIVAVPVYILLAWLSRSDIEQNPEVMHGRARRNTAYLTIFLASAALAGSLVIVIYYFLDGRDITAAFLLKSLVWAIVAGKVLTYTILDLKNKFPAKLYRLAAFGLALGAVLVIGIGFAAIGSPRDQRIARYDRERIMHLQSIQNEVISYWQQKGTLPATISDLATVTGYVPPKDPESAADYAYRLTGERSYELCASFGASGDKTSQGMTTATNFYGRANDNWAYERGDYCFSRTVSPEMYPLWKQ